MSPLLHRPPPSNSAEPFARNGHWRAESPLPGDLIRFLQTQCARQFAQIAVPRPWHYAELHNPWSRAAATFDSWGFLDLCQSPSLIEKVAKLIGPDLILFDSEWLPDRWQPVEAETALESDAHRFPVDPPCGVTALIGVGDAARATVHVDYQPSHPRAAGAHTDVLLGPGAVLFLGSRVPYRARAAGDAGVPNVYAVRYFPASSRYERDPTACAHRALTERYPLFNYARFPLWLVHGQDRAGNDFVTGFNVRAGYWTSAEW
jgi:hypothetical protein